MKTFGYGFVSSRLAVFLGKSVEDRRKSNEHFVANFIFLCAQMKWRQGSLLRDKKFKTMNLYIHSKNTLSTHLTHDVQVFLFFFEWRNKNVFSSVSNI
jgi:hypothetical protein